jgi:hypothetical protein
VGQRPQPRRGSGSGRLSLAFAHVRIVPVFGKHVVFLFVFVVILVFIEIFVVVEVVIIDVVVKFFVIQVFVIEIVVIVIEVVIIDLVFVVQFFVQTSAGVEVLRRLQRIAGETLGKGFVVFVPGSHRLMRAPTVQQQCRTRPTERVGQKKMAEPFRTPPFPLEDQYVRTKVHPHGN